MRGHGLHHHPYMIASTLVTLHLDKFLSVVVKPLSAASIVHVAVEYVLFTHMNP